MRYQFNRRDETDNIIRSIIRIHGHQNKNILVRLRTLCGQDYLAYSAPSKLLRAHGSGSAAGSPEVAATTVRLLLAQLTWNSKRSAGGDWAGSPRRGVGHQKVAVSGRWPSTTPITTNHFDLLNL